MKESDTLAGLEDADILTLACLDRRVLVTENMADFAGLARDVQTARIAPALDHRSIII